MTDPGYGPSPPPRRFIWGDQKNRANVRQHGLSFADGPLILRGRMVVGYDDREEYGEDRWIKLGLLSDLVVVIVFSEPDPHTIRIISLRRALRYERQQFYAAATH